VKVKAVRGAVGVADNSEKAIHDSAALLLREVLARNRISEGEVISILFSITRDLTRGNPATGVRALGFSETPLFCLQEADIEGALPRIIRVLVTYSCESESEPIPIYLGSAQDLRPDLSG